LVHAQLRPRKAFYRLRYPQFVPRFGSSGIRGLGNVDITPDLALRVGKAVGELYGDTIIGRDPRLTGPMLVQALGAGLLSSGAGAWDAGLVSTPTLARGARNYACGIMVTASHNPAPYNGLKLWNPDGMAFDEDQQREVEEALDKGRFAAPSWDRTGLWSSRTDLVEAHIDAILETVEPVKLRVVVDCGCGATCTITPFLLRRMGCDVVAIHAQPDGYFPGREPEPTEENLAALAATVRATRADLGIAHDGDGDRMVAVDRQGHFVGGDLLLGLFARQEVRTGLVVPVDASMSLSDLVPKATIWRTRVGDVHVAAEVKRRGAEFGGEPSGTWIFPRASLCPDGVYAASRLVSMAAEKPLDLLVKEIPQYPVHRGSIPYAAVDREAIERRLDAALRGLGADVTVLDGWRLDFHDGWALVRFSGTEPKIRVLAESREKGRAKEIYSTIVSSVKGAAA
jgi:phosphoglucosamine mutase